jgi:hypothetical protein
MALILIRPIATHIELAESIPGRIENIFLIDLPTNMLT